MVAVIDKACMGKLSAAHDFGSHLDRMFRRFVGMEFAKEYSIN